MTWTEFKNYIVQKNSVRYYEANQHYDIWKDLGGRILNTDIRKTTPPSDDQADFETNYKSFCNLVDPRATEDGAIAVSQTYGSTPETAVWKRRKHVTTAGETTFFDIEVTTEIRLRGGSYRLINYSSAHDDDYIEFSIIDKNDVLGLFILYGLIVGVDVLELHKFVKYEFVKDRIGEHEFGRKSWSAFPIIPGLFIRIAYNSYGTTDIEFMSRLLHFE